jgi:ABC-type multidrug transport system, ATPase and permease components
MKHTVGNIFYIIKKCASADKSFIFVSLGVYMLRFITPVSNVLGLKYLIDTLTERKDFSRVLIIVALYCAANLFKESITAWYENKYKPVAQVRISRYLDLELMARTTALDLSDFDDPEFFDKYTRAKNEITGRAIDVVTTICGLIGSIVSIASLSVVIIATDPLLITCIIAGVLISFIFDLFKSKIYYRFDLETTKANRRIDYIRRIFYEPQYLTELRLFSVKSLAMLKYSEYINNLSAILNRQGKTKTAIGITNAVLNSVLFSGVSFIYLSYRVFTGFIGIGDFSAMYSAVFSFGNELYSFVSLFPNLYRHSLFIDNIRSVLQTQGTIELSDGIILDPAIPHSVEFRNVSFSYADGTAALKKLSFKAEAGKKTSIVGYNGAGKSTLIKLLCRLYDPDSGYILIDDIDIKEFNTQSLRAAFGIVMQDFRHYAFTVAENIMPTAAVPDRNAVISCLEKTGLSEKISANPNNINAHLTREFDSDGILLSGGEFQKLSLARALAQNAHTLVLDEVTSALDPLAEAKLNGLLLDNTNDRTVIFISHRLNSSLYADMIYMLDSGSLAESGSHEELLKLNGKYAELYNLQMHSRAC